MCRGWPAPPHSSACSAAVVPCRGCGGPRPRGLQCVGPEHEPSPPTILDSLAMIVHQPRFDLLVFYEVVLPPRPLRALFERL